MTPSGVRVTVHRASAPHDTSVLSPDEWRRVARIRSAAARGRYVAGRTCLRSALADALGCEPRAVPLRLGQEGRPELTIPSTLSFSVSHSGDVVVVAVSATGPVGVDVERADRSPLPPAAAWLTDSERRTLERLPESVRDRALVRRWTAKEAVTKALGAGLTVPLASVRVAGARAESPCRTWRLTDLDVPTGVVATLATEVR